MNFFETCLYTTNLNSIAITAVGVFGCICIILPIAILSVPFIIISTKNRLKFSAGPLGLRKVSLKPMKHAICNVELYNNLESFTSSLTSKSARNTISKHVPKALKEHNVTITSIDPIAMGYTHWLIVYEHEKDAYGFGIKSFLASIFRYSVAKSMTGLVDCYYIPNECGGKKTLIAWVHTIIKADTLRGMWFYQGSYARKKRLYIWFNALRASVKRATLQKEIKWIDLGPSTTTKAEESKIKFGFSNRIEWKGKYECKKRSK